jgi:hypothetical protein
LRYWSGVRYPCIRPLLSVSSGITLTSASPRAMPGTPMAGAVVSGSGEAFPRVSSSSLFVREIRSTSAPSAGARERSERWLEERGRLFGRELEHGDEREAPSVEGEAQTRERELHSACFASRGTGRGDMDPHNEKALPRGWIGKRVSRWRCRLVETFRALRSRGPPSYPRPDPRPPRQLFIKGGEQDAHRFHAYRRATEA